MSAYSKAFAITQKTAENLVFPAVSWYNKFMDLGEKNVGEVGDE